MRFFKYAVVLAIGLTGCNSFNTYDQTARHQGNVPKSTKDDRGFWNKVFGDDVASDTQTADVPQPAGQVAARDEQGRVLCPVARMAAVPPLPALPLDQLKQLSPKDKDAIIALLTDHVSQLRDYATKVRDQQNAERARYQIECRRWAMQHQQ